MRRLTIGTLLALALSVGMAGDTRRAGVAEAQSGEVEAAIQEASRVWPVPARRLRCLALRESTFNPAAYNPAGPYFGIVQFGWPLWARGLREARNPADPDWPLVPPTAMPTQPRAALLMAGYFIAKGETSHWPPLRSCG